VKVTNNDDEQHYVFYSLDGRGYDRYLSVPAKATVASDAVSVVGSKNHAVRIKWLDGGNWYYSDEANLYVSPGSTVEFRFFVGMKPQPSDDLLSTRFGYLHEADEHPSIRDFQYELAYIDNLNVPAAASAQAWVDVTHPYRGDMMMWVGYDGGYPHIIYNRAGGSADDLHLRVDLVKMGFSRLDFQSNHRWYLMVYDASAGSEGLLDSFQILVEPDTDGDGVADPLEVAWGNSPTQCNPYGIPSGQGVVKVLIGYGVSIGIGWILYGDAELDVWYDLYDILGLTDDGRNGVVTKWTTAALSGGVGWGASFSVSFGVMFVWVTKDTNGDGTVDVNDDPDLGGWDVGISGDVFGIGLSVSSDSLAFSGGIGFGASFSITLGYEWQLSKQDVSVVGEALTWLTRVMNPALPVPDGWLLPFLYDMM